MSNSPKVHRIFGEDFGDIVREEGWLWEITCLPLKDRVPDEPYEFVTIRVPTDFVIGFDTTVNETPY